MSRPCQSVEMRSTARSRSMSLLVAGGLLLVACGGGSDATDDSLPSADDAATTEIVEQEPLDSDDPAVSGEAPADAAAGGAYSGGVVAADFNGVCDILDNAKVAELFSIEATSVVSSVNTGTGVCEFGDGGTVRLLVSRPDISLGMDAPDFFRQTVDSLISEGLNVGEAEVNGITRAAFVEGNKATIAFALDPFYVELRDTNGQDIVLTVLVADVVEALR